MSLSQPFPGFGSAFDDEKSRGYFREIFSKAVSIFRNVPGATDGLSENLLRAYPIAERCFLQLCERRNAFHGDERVRQYAALNVVLACFHAVLSIQTEQKDTFLPLEIYERIALVGCSDTRIHGSLFGIEPENLYRLPGGRDAEAFLRDESGGMVFCPESSLGTWILEHIDSGVQMISFVGHTGCAACRMETMDNPDCARQDEGAFYGFCQQVEMAQALERFLEGCGSSVPVVPILYDVSSGNVFLGLDACLDDRDLKRQGFSEENLTRFSAQRAPILSTSSLLQCSWLAAEVGRLQQRYQSASFPTGIDVRSCLTELLDGSTIRRETKRAISGAFPRFAGNTEVMNVLRYVLLASIASRMCRTVENSGHALRNKASLIRVGSDHGFPLVARALALSDFNSQHVGLLAEVVRGGRINGSLGEFDRRLFEEIFPQVGDYANLPVTVVMEDGWSIEGLPPLSFPRNGVCPIHLTGTGDRLLLTPM